nr:ATP-binding protein [Kitasatospora sp. SID7827]
MIGPLDTTPIDVPIVQPTDSSCLLRLPCCPQSAGFARKLVRSALTAWSAPELDDVAALLVTELVANAAKHTGCTRIAVAVRRQSSSVRVGVRDSSGELPALMAPAHEAESGYGLGLVAALAQRWGVECAPRGKWVWFELRVEAT